MKKIISVVVLLVTIVSISCSTRGTQEKGNEKQGNATSKLSGDTLEYLNTPPNAEYILVLSHVGNIDNYNHLAAMVLKSSIENKSNGRIGIKIYPNAQLAGSGREEANALINGTIDIAKVTGELAPFWAPTAAFEIPYIISDDRVAESVYSDPELVEKARQDILSVQPSLRLMAIASSGGWRSFATTKKQIKQPSDVKGLKIRTVASKVQQDLVTSFGGAATAMPYAEIYTSLSTGVVDGVKLSIVDIVTAKLHESLRYYILDNHSYLVGFWFINEQTFKEIPEDLRPVVADGFEDLRAWLSAYPKYASIAAYDAFRAEGGEIYTPTASEFEAFKIASKPTREKLISESDASVREWAEYLEEKSSYHQNRIDERRLNETK